MRLGPMPPPGTIADVPFDEPCVAVFGSGPSVLDMTLEEVREVKSRCFVVMMNYATCRFGCGEMDMLAFHDASVALWLADGHAKPDVGLWASEAAFPLAQYRDGGRSSVGSLHCGVRCWFRSSRGNFTLTNMLHDLRELRRNKRVLLFGMDMRGTGRWYDEAMGFEPIEPEDEKRYFAGHARELGFVDAGGMVFNCTPGSALDVFPKAEWRKAV